MEGHKGATVSMQGGYAIAAILQGTIIVISHVVQFWESVELIAWSLHFKFASYNSGMDVTCVSNPSTENYTIMYTRFRLLTS